MSTIAMESNISTYISEFIDFLDVFDWFEGVMVNAKKIGEVVNFTLNLVFDGSKTDNNVFRQCNALFKQIMAYSGLNITLNMVDIDTKDSDSLLEIYNSDILSSGKILSDKNGILGILQSEFQDELHEDLNAIQYIKK